MSERLDALGDPLPEGYEQWRCETCTACCNFEVMMYCDLVRRENLGAVCGYEKDRPLSNYGCFAFIVPARSNTS